MSDENDEPWKSYQDTNTAVADETDGPWTQFKSSEPESDQPWLEYQSSQPAPVAAQPQVNSLAPQMDMSLLSGASPATTVELGTPGDTKLYHPTIEPSPDYLDPEKVAAQERELSRGLLTRAGIGPENMPTGQELMTATGAHPSIAYPLSAVAKTATSVVDWMTSPIGFPQMVAASIPGLNVVMAAKFAKDMVEGGYVSAKDVGVGLAEGDWQKVAEGVSNYAANVLGVKAVVGHGIKNAKAETGKFGEFLQGPGPEFNVEKAAALGGQPVRFNEPTEQSGIPDTVPSSEAATAPPSASSTPTPAVKAQAVEVSSKPDVAITADTILKRGAGETSHTDIGSMNDEQILKLADAKNEGGGKAYPANGDSTVWGAKQGPEMVPILENLKAEAGKKMMAAQMNEMALSNDKTGTVTPEQISAAGKAFKAEYFRKLWYDTALEGAKRDGPNYQRALADGRIKPSEQPTPAAEAPAAPTVKDSDVIPGESWADGVIARRRGVQSLDPELLAAYGIKGVGIITRGVRDFAAWSAEMVKQFGEKIKPELQAIWEDAQSRMKGMGAATMEEVSPQGTGLKNETGRLERVLHGLPEEYRTVARSMPDVFLEADEILKADPKAGEKLAAELKINPERGMTDTDSALLLRHKVALENAKNEAASDTFTAETPSEKAEAQARFDGLSNELLDLLDAAKFRGSQWGREGRWRQALAFDDYSLETMKRDKKLSLDRDLTPEENAQIQKLHERIAELETQLAGKEKSTKQTQRGKVMDETVSETGKRAKSSAAKDKAKGVERDLAGEETDAINHLKDRFIEQGDLTGGNPTIKKLMELLYRKGHTERISLENAVHDILKKQVDPTIPLEEVQDLMSGYGKYTEPSKDPVKAGVREVQGQILQVKKMLDIVRKGFAKPTGFLRQQAGQVQRNLQKAVNELKKQYGIPQDSAKALQSALDTVKTRLRNRILDIKQELASKEKIISKRSPSPSDAETVKLRAELDELQRQRDEMFPKEPITPEEQLKRLEASADRQIKQLERNIATGEIFPKSKQPSNLNSERLAAARAKIEALKQERDAMRETIQPTAEPEVRQLQQLLDRLRNREAEYKDRLAQGRFEPRAKKEQPVSPEVLDARARVETAKRDFQKGLTLDKMKRRSIGSKIYAGIKEGLNLPRAMLSAFDVSAVLRQGGFISFGHPIRAAKSIVPMFKALASEKQALRVEQEILSRSNAGRYAASKLYLASFDEFRLSKQEEIMMSRFANVIPGVRMSNRAFMVFLNKLRADSFDAMTKSLESRGTKLQPNELEAVSNYINVATGRGDLGKAAAASETLATVFFSPRNAISRFQLILGNPAYRGSARTRILVAKEYARFLGGLAVIYGLGALAGAKVETDPRSTDFGKLRFGNTRVDPMTGLSQATVLLSRVTSGTQKTSKGKIVPVRGEKVPYGSSNSADLLARFARTKLAPTVGTTVDALTGKNVVGQPVTPGSAAMNLVTPLSMKDIYDVMKEQGVPEGTAFGILSLFGMSLQNYEPMKPKSSGIKYEKSN